MKDSIRLRLAATLDDEGRSTDRTRTLFLGEVPPTVDGTAIWRDLDRQFEGEELAELAAEIVLTLTAGCTADEFHSWDYDHLEAIIELANAHRFRIPRNFVNGLPEQLIILVDHDSLTDPGCDDPETER